jgi:hypothetical protein
MDPGLHSLQGKTESVKPTELLALLQDCYRQRLELMLRHQAVARHIGNLDVNNTYQYVIAREETQLGWLRDAIEELGGVAPGEGTEPVLTAANAEAVSALIRGDTDAAQQYVDTWRPRIQQVTNARHRGMLQVISGETLEHKRFFEQALAGRDDLLGRRLDAGPRRGAVIGTRWVGE